MTCGKLIGVSLGPGDPGLITRKGWEALTGAGLWTYPVRNDKSDSYALAIASAAGLTPPADATRLIFPMIHDEAILKKHWEAAAAVVLPILRGGRDVLFLVEGDASTYSTFNHLARTVRAMDDQVPVEVIAGVSSFNAAAAATGIPLADADETMAILPAGYGIAVIEKALEDYDTLILMKVKPLIDEILALLEERDLLQESFFVEKVGTPEERIVRDVALLKETKINYLSLLVVKNPHRVRGQVKRGCRKNPAGEERS